MDFPLIVENRLKVMSNSEKNAFYEEYKRRRKSVFVGYLLLIPLGWHYAYVKKWGTQILCWVTLWGLVIWWLIDWFRIPFIIGRYNRDLSVKIMTEIALIYGNTSISKATNIENNLEIWLKENPEKSLNDYYKNR